MSRVLISFESRILPTKPRAVFDSLQSWLWFSSSVVSPYVTESIKWRCEAGTFKDAAAAWMGMGDAEKVALLWKFWSEYHMDSKCEICETYEDASDPLDPPGILALALRERVWRERVMGDAGRVAATAVQMRWRHWRWRKHVLWNPETDAGKRWLAAMAAVFERRANA